MAGEQGMDGLRLLILSQYFPPETGAPQARLSEMALLLRARGVEVEILTAMPSYPTGRIFDAWRGRWMMRRPITSSRCAGTSSASTCS